MNRPIVLDLGSFIGGFESVSRLECDELSCFCCLSCELTVFVRVFVCLERVLVAQNAQIDWKLVLLCI